MFSKAISVLIIFTMLLGAASASAQATTTDTISESNILVAYFSCTGNTKAIAELVAEAAGADLFEIMPEVPYTSEDLDYNNSASRSNQERADASFRPAIAEALDTMEQYDTVFIGYPIWWGQAPQIVLMFLESYDFAGKTVVTFCTSGSSGMGSSSQTLHAYGADDTVWVDGIRFNSNASLEDVSDWVNALDLNQ